MKIDTAFFIGNWNHQKVINAVDGVCFSIVGYEDSFKTKKKPVQAIKIVYNQSVISYERLLKHFSCIQKDHKRLLSKKASFLPAEEKHQNFIKKHLF